MPRHHLLAGVGASACLTLAAVALPLPPSQAQVPAHAGAAATAPAATWVATHTQGLHLKGRSLGQAPARQRLSISVALPLRHADRIDDDIAARSNPASPSYGHFLTPVQVRQRYGPTAGTAASVAGYLRRGGLRDVKVTSNRLLVNASGSVRQVQRAFHTSIGLFRVRGQRVYANTTPAMVPAALRSDVTAVLGLSNYSMSVPAGLHHPPTGSGPDTNGFLPRQVAKVYEATSLAPAKRTEISVVAAGDMRPIIAHLRTAERQQHFAKAPVKVVYTAPKAAIVNDNPLTGNAEWDLDVQISTFMAGAVKRLDIYDIATFTDSDVTNAVNRFVTDDKARTLSASLGECDALAYADGSLITTDEAIAEGGLQGQSVFASTGDNGSFCPEGASTGVPGGGPGQSWPAVGEYTTAVGGTTLVADDNGHVSQELAWVGGGGGISTFGNAGPWTLQANTAGQAAEYNNFGGRGVPDVSAVADPETGVLIYTGKANEVVGGTSVSSPLVSGLWARLENSHRGKLGLASYRLYHLYNAVNPGTVVPGVVPTYAPNAHPGPVPGIHDVTLGANGAFTAKPGYDYTTGVGTPRLRALDKAL